VWSRLLTPVNEGQLHYEKAVRRSVPNASQVTQHPPEVAVVLGLFFNRSNVAGYRFALLLSFVR
jgi:hypothetical protein